MARACWLVVAALTLGGCLEQRRELEEEKAKNARLEMQVQAMDAQLGRLRKQLEEAKASAAPAQPTAAASDEKTLQDAQDAYVHGEYRKAIDLARGGIAAAPGRAWRVIGAAHCFLKEQSDVREAMSHLDSQGKQFLKYVCSRNGVSL